MSMKWAVVQLRDEGEEHERYVPIRAHGPFDSHEAALRYGSEIVYPVLESEYEIVQLAAPVPRAKDLSDQPSTSAYEETAELLEAMINLLTAEKERADRLGTLGPTDDDIKVLRHERQEALRLARADHLDREIQRHDER